MAWTEEGVEGIKAALRPFMGPRCWIGADTIDINMVSLPAEHVDTVMRLVLEAVERCRTPRADDGRWPDTEGWTLNPAIERRRGPPATDEAGDDVRRTTKGARR